MSRTKSWRSSRYLRGIQDTSEGEINITRYEEPKRKGNNKQDTKHSKKFYEDQHDNEDTFDD